MKSELHSRNKHNNGYDFDVLKKHNPDLKKHLVKKPDGALTVNFNDANAVKELNKSLLYAYYNMEYWDLPSGYLCPPVPGRVDYIHHIADLIFDNHPTLKTTKIKGLDIGVGANMIYPILGQAEYNWRFVGAEINTDSIRWAKTILEKNPHLANNIKIRKQKNKSNVLSGLIKAQERFDFTICNPPFHSSEEEAIKSNETKAKKLGIKAELNFGGVHSELWCKGGEVEFVKIYIEESEKFQHKVLWFTCLVSKKASLELLVPKIERNKHIKQFKIVEMAQGQKKSRFLAWSFLTNKQIAQWKREW